MEVLGLALELGINLEHINFVELLSSKLDVFVVEDVEFVLELRQLGNQILLRLNVCLHLFFLEGDSFLKDSFLGVKLLDLTLSVIC